MFKVGDVVVILCPDCTSIRHKRAHKIYTVDLPSYKGFFVKEQSFGFWNEEAILLNSLTRLERLVYNIPK